MTEVSTQITNPSADEISRLVALIVDDPLFCRCLDTVNDIVLVLNEHRQAVFCNAAFAATFGLAQPSTIYGMLPGQIWRCANCPLAAGGCGTGERCSVCGARATILDAIDVGRESCGEFHLLRKDGIEALDLFMRVTPFDFYGHNLLILAMRDISQFNRHMVMEHIFYHDVLNTAFGVKLLAESTTWSRKANATLNRIHTSAMRLMEEINAQKDLAAAESGELILKETAIGCQAFLAELIQGWVPFAQAKGCILRLRDPIHDAQVVTDRQLLGRVICNMIKNAIESSTTGQTIECWCQAAPDAIAFSVSNQAYIPRPHQLQIFQRSFSTKGDGRGMGTYSMRLIAEKYLGGKMGFTSDEVAGTVFTATIPLSSHL